MIKLKNIMNEGTLSKSSLEGLSDMELGKLEDSYYGVADHIKNLQDYLQVAAGKNPDWKGEYTIAKQLVKLFDKLEAGKIL